MNPVFWFLVFLAAVVLWLAISFIFIPLGGLLLKLVKRIFNIINYEENDSENDADIKVTKAEAEAKANKLKSESLTPELIQMTEAEARLKHGWVTVQGADATVVDASEK